MHSLDIHLQIHNWAYCILKITPTKHNHTQLSTIGTLQIHWPNVDPILCVPSAPLHQTIHNPHARVIHSYNIIDELDESNVGMFELEIL